MRYVAVLSLVVVFGAAESVFTITNGQPDGTEHPYVGLAFQPIPGTNLATICSGSALSPTVFLTAAHCFNPAAQVFVTFKSEPPFDGTVVSGTVIPHPDGQQDVALITLDQSVLLAEYINLPAAGLADTLAMKSPVTLVGYGVQTFIVGDGPPEGFTNLVRMMAPAQLIQSQQWWSFQFLKLTANPSKGGGGMCFGDSGGPNVLEGAGVGNDIVLGVNTFVTNNNCTGLTYSNRIDLPVVLEWIEGILSQGA